MVMLMMSEMKWSNKMFPLVIEADSEQTLAIEENGQSEYHLTLFQVYKGKTEL